MKMLSASIIVLTGGIVLSVGSLVGHHDTKLFLQFVGCGVGITGLMAWHKTFRIPDK